MKKYLLVLILGVTSLIAADGKALASKCIACHGGAFEKQALGKSVVVKGQKAEAIEKSLLAYKEGKLNKFGMGPLMRGQTASLSKEDIKILSVYIASLK